MRIFLRDQTAALADFIPEFKSLPLSYSSLEGLRERETSLDIPAPKSVEDLSSCPLTAFWGYDIFPSAILTYAAQWTVEKRPMRVGDVIVQQAFLPPASLSLKMVFGVRILAIEKGRDKVGFRYGTLSGHAETGVSEFEMVKTAAGIQAVIHTWSAPGLWLSRLAGPFFTMPYQAYSTRKALEGMRDGFLYARKNI